MIYTFFPQKLCYFLLTLWLIVGRVLYFKNRKPCARCVVGVFGSSGSSAVFWSGPTHQDDSAEVGLAAGDGDRAVPVREPVGQDTGARAAAVGQTHIKRWERRCFPVEDGPSAQDQSSVLPDCCSPGWELSAPGWLARKGQERELCVFKMKFGVLIWGEVHLMISSCDRRQAAALLSEVHSKNCHFYYCCVCSTCVIKLLHPEWADYYYHCYYYS